MMTSHASQEYSDKTWVSDQSERAQGPIYIIICDKTLLIVGNMYLLIRII